MPEQKSPNKGMFQFVVDEKDAVVEAVLVEDDAGVRSVKLHVRKRSDPCVGNGQIIYIDKKVSTTLTLPPSWQQESERVTEFLDVYRQDLNFLTDTVLLTRSETASALRKLLGMVPAQMDASEYTNVMHEAYNADNKQLGVFRASLHALCERYEKEVDA